MDRNKLGTFLRKIRKAQKLSQTQLAEKIGYSLDAVGNWEKGERAITLEAFVRILKVTHIKVVIGDKEAKTCIRIL